VIILAVRWYLCNGLSYRDVEELLAVYSAADRCGQAVSACRGEIAAYLGHVLREWGDRVLLVDADETDAWDAVSLANLSQQRTEPVFAIPLR
jgi:hypothetical protein